MISTIRTTLQILSANPALLLLAMIPSLITVAFSTAAVYLAWEYRLQSLSPWLGIPLGAALFIASWIVIGSLSLIPVEDAIINRVQKALLGRIVLPEQGMSLGRIWRELKISLTVAMFLFASVFFALIPFGATITVVVTIYAITLSALSPLHSRSGLNLGERFDAIKREPLRYFALGFVLYLLLFIPLLNVFFLGFALALCTVHQLQSHSKAAPPL